MMSRRKYCPLTFDKDLLKTWVEENLDLYKVREYYTPPPKGAPC
jgi:hypothetical protein